MVQGKIKWFNNAKGIGFLSIEDESRDVFVHYSKIEMDGYKTVNSNQEVRVEVVEGEKGLFAEKVELL